MHRRYLLDPETHLSCNSADDYLPTQICFTDCAFALEENKAAMQSRYLPTANHELYSCEERVFQMGHRTGLGAAGRPDDPGARHVLPGRAPGRGVVRRRPDAEPHPPARAAPALPASPGALRVRAWLHPRASLGLPPAALAPGSRASRRTDRNGRGVAES